MLFARTGKGIPSLFSFLLTLVSGLAAGLTAQSIAPVSWSDLPPAIQQRLERSGLDGPRFLAWTADLRARHSARMREGDEDHLVFYALQSTRITSAPPIEPAVSARMLVATLDSDTRARFLADPSTLAPRRIPRDAHSRLRAMVRAVEKRSDDARLGYFRTLLMPKEPSPRSLGAWRAAADRRVERGYARAMRFLAEQDVEARGERAAEGVAALYRTRGLSTDSSVEAGFLVREGLATLKAIEPGRRIARVAIVGPGYDLAPRTGYHDLTPPQSLQPFAVMDALVALGLSDLASLKVTCLDINPRVVAALTTATRLGALLMVASGVTSAPNVTPTEEFQRYVETLGAAVTVEPPMAGVPPYRRVPVAPRGVAALDPHLADIVLDRLPLDADLVVITNVLPYFDDRELALALANIHAMLASGGVLIHNEARPAVGEITAALGLPLVQARTAMIATVRDAPPVYDSVFIHRKR
jgi:hypothetical protein